MGEEEDISPLTARLLDEEQEEKLDNNEQSKEMTASILNKDDDETATPIAVTTVQYERGEKQPPAFRDWYFGLLFHGQFFTVITLGFVYFNSVINTNLTTLDQYNNEDQSTNNGEDFNLMTILLPTSFSAFTALLLILLALVILTQMSKAFITCSVWTSAFTSLAMGVAALSTGIVPLGILSLFSALIGVCYALAVRNRIPFAAANLDAGASAIKANFGVTFIVLFLSGVMLGWMVLWMISLIGVVHIELICDDGNNHSDNYCSIEAKQPGWIVPWVFFLFWTQQVFKNIIHTSVAGLVGTWFFNPDEATSCCSKAIGSSFGRSCTYSFGSICFGSLCVAILQTLDWLVNVLRGQREQNGDQHIVSAMFLCCLDCILSMLQGIMEYFNKYAFVYVGVYGYRFMTAGKKVMTLFKHRGWTVVINDNLVSNALGLMCFVISLMSGAVPLAFVTEEDGGGLMASVFSIGFVNALLLSMTVMSIIDSAVATVIVCFAEAPEVFETNHGEHSRNMKEAWRQIYNISF